MAPTPDPSSRSLSIELIFNTLTYSQVLAKLNPSLSFYSLHSYMILCCDVLSSTPNPLIDVPHPSSTYAYSVSSPSLLSLFQTWRRTPLTTPLGHGPEPCAELQEAHPLFMKEQHHSGNIWPLSHQSASGLTDSAKQGSL